MRLNIWTVIFFVVLVDIYIERFTGSNIFGFGKIEIDGVPQQHGIRVVSFFRTEHSWSFYMWFYIYNCRIYSKFFKIKKNI